MTVGRHALVSQQPLQQLKRRPGVPLSLHYKVQNLAFAVNCPPQVHLLASDVADHFIQVPYVDDPLPARCVQLIDQIACVHMSGL